jgi:hypothetical protein
VSLEDAIKVSPGETVEEQTMQVGVAIGGENVRGMRATANCPFHEDADQHSLVVDIRGGAFHCTGCGAQGNVVTTVAMIERTDEEES